MGKPKNKWDGSLEYTRLWAKKLIKNGHHIETDSFELVKAVNLQREVVEEEEDGIV